MAASLHRLAMSAPTKPGVSAASRPRSTAAVQRQVASVHAKDRQAALARRAIDEDLPVEAAGPQQRRVEHLGAVGGPHDDDADAAVKAVHLDQDLVERVLALVVSAHGCALPGARLADRVQLIDEDDARGFAFGFGEQVAYARGADADEHLDEVGAAQAEERHAGFSGDRARQQRLAGAGRADEQHAFGQLGAELGVAVRLLQERDDLLGLLDSFIDAGDVAEVHQRLRVGLEDLRLALADVEHPGALAHAPHDHHPDDDHDADGQDPVVEEVAQPVRLDLGAEGHAVVLERLEQVVVAQRDDGEAALRLFGRRPLCRLDPRLDRRQPLVEAQAPRRARSGDGRRRRRLGACRLRRRLHHAVDVIAGDDNAGHLAAGNAVQEVAVGDGGRLLAGEDQGVEEQEQRHAPQVVQQAEAHPRRGVLGAHGGIEVTASMLPLLDPAHLPRDRRSRFGHMLPLLDPAHLPRDRRTRFGHPRPLTVAKGAGRAHHCLCIRPTRLALFCHHDLGRYRVGDDDAMMHNAPPFVRKERAQCQRPTAADQLRPQAVDAGPYPAHKS